MHDVLLIDPIRADLPQDLPAIGVVVRAGPDAAPFKAGDRVFLIVDREEDIGTIQMGSSRFLVVRASNLLAKVDYAGMCALIALHVKGER